MKGKSADFLGKSHFFSIKYFILKKLKLKNNFEYSFDAEKAYLSIGEVFRAIRGRYRNEISFPKKNATLCSKLRTSSSEIFSREKLWN